MKDCVCKLSGGTDFRETAKKNLTCCKYCNLLLMNSFVILPLLMIKKMEAHYLNIQIKLRL